MIPESRDAIEKNERQLNSGRAIECDGAARCGPPELRWTNRPRLIYI